jgi:NADH-quinone oxidoreductase subunit L
VHTQDMREMGGLKKKLPVTYWTFLIATLALAGVPCFAGYYSKDQIVANALAWGVEDPQVLRFIPVVFAAAGAFMTTFYMLRLVFLTFHGAPRDVHKYEHAHESPPVMAVPLLVLAGFAMFGGGTLHPLPHVEHLWFNELVVQPESAAAEGLHLWTPAQQHALEEHHEHALHASHYPAIGISILAILAGWLLARAMYLKHSADPAVAARRFGVLYDAAVHKYWFDEMYAQGVVGSLKRLNGFLAAFDRRVVDGLVNLTGLLARLLAFVSGLFDKYVIDGLVNFWRFFVRGMSGVFRLLQTGNARDYLTWTLLSVLILAIYLARGH